MSAKRLRELLVTRGVRNDHDLSKVVQPTPPVISYAKADRYWTQKWYVWRVGFNLDPNAHWHDRGKKVFAVGKVHGVSDKSEQFIAATAWASERYTQWSDEWVKTPFGSWMPQDALEQALQFHLPELFDGAGRTPKVVGDSVVKRITDKLYGEDPEFAESVPSVDPYVMSLDGDGWYRVVGSGVAVFIHATNQEDALKRVKFMAQRMSMDASLEWHITKRDPEV